MKEIVLNKIEVSFIVFSFILSSIISQVFLIKKEHVKTITPFHINFGQDSSIAQDPENILSGNSGISKEYYSKQLRQLLNNNIN